MSAREEILSAIRRNRPADAPLPAPVPGSAPPEGVVEGFARVLRAIGGRVVEAERGGVEAALRACYPDAVRVASTAPHHLAGTVELAAVDDPHHLADLDLMVCEAALGVAENGAVWLPESRLGHRAAPFITQHLAVVLDRRDVVAELGEAYRRVRVDAEGYGVFVAGPSKTADIEQSLVIGAHGPRSLTVVLL